MLREAEDSWAAVVCGGYLMGHPGLVVRALAAPVADDEQAERAVVLGQVLQPDQLRGGRRAQERSHGEKGEERCGRHGSFALRHRRPRPSLEAGAKKTIDGTAGLDSGRDI